MNITLDEYIQQCIHHLENLSNKGLLNGLGELMDDNMTTFVRNKLKNEVITLLKLFKEFPIIA